MVTTNKVIVITGATGTIGAGLVEHHAKKKHTVVLGVRNVTRGEDLVADIKTRVPDAKLVVEEVNYESFDSMGAFADRVQAQFPKVDVLVNNVGDAYVSRTLIETAEGTMFVNAAAWIHMMDLFIPSMKREAVDGVLTPSYVINNVSFYAEYPDIEDITVGNKAYNPYRAFRYANASVRVMIHMVAPVYQNAGINVIALHPGTITSPLLKLAEFPRGLDTIETILRNTDLALEMPLSRAGCFIRDDTLTLCEYAYEDENDQIFDYFKTLIPFKNYNALENETEDKKEKEGVTEKDKKNKKKKTVSY